MVFLRRSESLKNKVIRGSLWLGALRASRQGARLVTLLILARFLSPEDFGLFGIALLSVAVFETFTQFGFEQALIQRDGNIDSYLDPVWTFKVLKGLVVVGVIFLLAPLIASFFGETEVAPLLRVLVWALFFREAVNIGVVYFQKRLAFKEYFSFQVVGVICESLTVVALGLWLRSVWALVLGVVVGEAARFGLSYVVSSYRPKFVWSWEEIRELWQFGGWVFASGILAFLFTQGDDLVVGRVLGAAALGFYQIAYRLSNLPTTELTHVISQVLFPAYSSLQQDMARLAAVYKKVFATTFIVSLFFALGLIVGARFLTLVLLGPRWLPLVPALRVLAVWGFIRSLAGTTGPVLYGLGRPEIITRIQVAQVLSLAGLVYPLSVNYGILGTAAAVVAASLLPNLAGLLVTFRYLGRRA